MTPTSDSDEVTRLAEEFLERCRGKRRPSIDEYTTAYPHLANRIRELFPAILFAENIGPAWEPNSSTESSQPTVPTVLGEYRILREIGRGGMGIVYEAKQDSLGRHVALKVLPQSSLLSPTFRERFQREARAAARMHHSNIVPVFGVGENDGLLYYAMQFIHGQSLDKVLNEVQRSLGRAMTVGQGQRTPVSEIASSVAASLESGKFASAETPPHADSGQQHVGSTLSTDSRAEYFRSVARIGLQVANALGYAHRQGILHRDIKPSNLLMDTSGTVWVTDFGLAKADDDIELTHTGDFVGTIRYMPLERFRGDSRPVGDVYSLGVTLYELLTLRPAYYETDRAELLHQVMNQPPPSPRVVDQRIPLDLETIVNKAMAREVVDRYASADELAEDLQRFLADRPIAARRSRWTERTWRWCRRNPRLAGLMGLAAALLLVILIGSPIMSLRLYEQQLRTRAELWNVQVSRAQAQRLTNEAGRRFNALSALDEARLLLPLLQSDQKRIEHLRNEFIASMSLADLGPQPAWSGYPTGSTSVCFDAHFKHYARGDVDGAISIRRVVDDQEVNRLPGIGMGAWGLKFSPNGNFLAVGYHRKYRFNSEHFRVWELHKEKPILEVNSPTGCGEADFSPDGRWVAFGQDQDTLTIRDVTQVETPPRQFAVGALPSAIAFHPDGKQIAVAVNREVQIRNAASGELLRKRAFNTNVWNLAWQPLGRNLACAVGQNIYIIDDDANSSPAILRGHENVIYALAFSPDGRRLASKAHDGTVRYWDVATRQPLVRTNSVYTGCTPIHFSPDGKSLGYASDGRQLWYWQVADGNECRALAVPNVSTSYQPLLAEFSPDGKLIAVGSSHGVHVWDCKTGKHLATLPTQTNWGIRFTLDGTHLLTSSKTGLQRWPIQRKDDSNVSFGHPQSIGEEGQLQIMDVSRDGNTIIVRRFNGPAVVYRFTLPASPLVLGEHPQLNYVAVHPDASVVATGTMFGSDVRIWNATTGEPVKTIPCDASAAVTFSPDGRQLVMATEKDYRWCDTSSWDVFRVTLKQPETLPAPISFTSDNSLAVVRYSPTRLHLLNPASGQCVAELHAPNHQVLFWAALSMDGSRLAAAGHGGLIHLWNLQAIRQQLRDRGLDWN